MMKARVWWVLVGVLTMAVCYHIPWVTHDTAGFTMHGFDLAEWTSLHPAVRSSSPGLLTTLLLRVPLLAVVFALALVANSADDERMRWAIRICALLFAVRFIPPKEFFTSSSDDSNYRQMALLTLLSGAAVGVSLLIARLSQGVQKTLFVVVVVSGVVSGWWGLSRSGELFDNFELDVSYGIGIYGYTAAALLSVLVTLTISARESEPSASPGMPES